MSLTQFINPFIKKLIAIIILCMTQKNVRCFYYNFVIALAYDLCIIYSPQ